MGYSTDFDGEFKLEPPLTAAHVVELSDFADTRQPEGYCQWVPKRDGTGIVWDGGEKFYDYVEWLGRIIERFLKPWGHTLNGEVKWQGESGDDFGLLIVKDNVVMIRKGERSYAEPVVSYGPPKVAGT